jgi:hypothetical protein
MNRGARMVFDDTIEDNGSPSSLTTAYTSLVHSSFLAAAEQMSFHLVVDCAGGLGDAPVLQIQLSGDGRIWQDKYASSVALKQAGTTNVAHYTGGESWPTPPNFGFAKLKIQLSNKTLPFSARVHVHVTTRSRRSTAKRRLPVVKDNAAHVSAATMQEIATLLREERGVGPGAHARVAGRLSPAARAAMASLASDARNLTGAHRQRIAALALALQSAAPKPRRGG